MENVPLSFANESACGETAINSSEKLELRSLLNGASLKKNEHIGTDDDKIEVAKQIKMAVYCYIHLTTLPCDNESCAYKENNLSWLKSTKQRAFIIYLYELGDTEVS